MGLQGTGQRLINCWGNTIKSKISSQPGKISSQGSRERRQLCYWITNYNNKKAITNLGSVLKSRDITLPTKVCLIKAMFFPVVMYGCESWTIKKAEHQRIDVFKLWSWRKLLKVPWTARKPNQSILKEINPEYTLEGLKLKWKLQYFGHLMRRANSLENTLWLARTEGRRIRR